jgi:hypothetical protein
LLQTASPSIPLINRYVVNYCVDLWYLYANYRVRFEMRGKKLGILITFSFLCCWLLCVFMCGVKKLKIKARGGCVVMYEEGWWWMMMDENGLWRRWVSFLLLKKIWLCLTLSRVCVLCVFMRKWVYCYF